MLGAFLRISIFPKVVGEVVWKALNAKPTLRCLLILKCARGTYISVVEEAYRLASTTSHVPGYGAMSGLQAELCCCMAMVNLLLPVYWIWR